MKQAQLKDKAVIDKFQSLLRSGYDYNVEYMYAEAGSRIFITGRGAKRIINRYYRGIVTPEMREYIRELNCKKHPEEIELFSEEFSVCPREARLIIRYINKR